MFNYTVKLVKISKGCVNTCYGARRFMQKEFASPQRYCHLKSLLNNLMISLAKFH